IFFFFSSRRRHTRCLSDWSSDVCSSDLHIISDGWSLGVLVREFTALYGAYAEGRGSPLEELGIQYGDFAHWQREWLKGAVLEERSEERPCRERVEMEGGEE